MATWTKFHSYAARLAQGQLNLATDSIKLALSNSAPNVATGAVLTDITQISAGNGYVAGGFALAGSAITDVSGLWTRDFSDLVVTASGGAIADFRYPILFDDTIANDPLIAFSDLGAVISLSDGESYRFEFNAAGVLTVNAQNA